MLLPFLLTLVSAHASSPPPPKALIIVAHPDDEYCFAATVYRLARELGGEVDQVVITQGEGGFRYSTPSEKFYGKSLSTESVGHEYLPAIRKAELLGAGKILGIRDHDFLEQPDFGKSVGPGDALKRWNRAAIATRLDVALRRKVYDLVLTLLPIAATHGHHQAATILALEAVARLPETQRPVTLGCWNDTRKATRDSDQAEEIRTAKEYKGVDGFPITLPLASGPPLVFDRETPFGFKDKLNYQVFVNWMIAEHKSQGFFQTYVLRDDTEKFVVFAGAGTEGGSRAKAAFAALGPNPRPY